MSTGSKRSSRSEASRAAAWHCHCRRSPVTLSRTTSCEPDRTPLALHTLEATGDIRQVALWLGHASLRSTEMYLRVDPANKLDILAGAEPPQGILQRRA